MGLARSLPAAPLGVGNRLQPPFFSSLFSFVVCWSGQWRDSHGPRAAGPHGGRHRLTGPSSARTSPPWRTSWPPLPPQAEDFFEQLWAGTGFSTERTKRATAGLAAPKFDPEKFEPPAKPRPARSNQAAGSKRSRVRAALRCVQCVFLCVCVLRGAGGRGARPKRATIAALPWLRSCCPGACSRAGPGGGGGVRVLLSVLCCAVLCCVACSGRRGAHDEPRGDVGRARARRHDAARHAHGRGHAAQPSRGRDGPRLAAAHPGDGRLPLQGGPA